MLGEFWSKDNLTCEECPFDEYQDESLKFECKPCPDNTATHTTGAAGQGECKGKVRE